MTTWTEVKDGNAEARALFHRHYSYRPYRDGRQPKLFVGPGEKMVLLAEDRSALFVWRKFRSVDAQDGVSCAIFRNEGSSLSSDLIQAAEALASKRWGQVRVYTYVDPRRIRSRNPGLCFKRAGWRVCGRTKKRDLVILEKSLEGKA